MARRSNTTLVRAVCRNCGAATVGRYCHICGQDLFAGRNHRLRELVGDSLGTIFALDGKILKTLWYLVALPGRLTKEFYEGRIVRYVFPSKLFWFITIVFFALLWSTADIKNMQMTTNGEPAADSVATGIVAAMPATIETPAVETPVSGTGSESTNPAEETNAAEGTAATENADNWTVDVNGYKVDLKELMDYFSAWSPYIVLTLVPMFALLVMLMFWRRERYYSDYLVFALHFHSFLFLLLALGIVFNKVFPSANISELFVLWLPALWLGIALRSVYRARIVPMIFKIILLGFVYFILMIAMLVLFVMIFLIFIKNIDIFA